MFLKTASYSNCVSGVYQSCYFKRNFTFSGKSVLLDISSHIDTKAGQAYATALEHLADLMIRQELLVSHAVNQLRSRFNKSKNDYIPGFIAISDEEVDGLLGNCDVRSADVNNPDQESRIDEKLILLESHISERVALSIQSGIRLPFVELAGIFNLTTIEIDALVTCLATEIDQRYERFYGYLQDDMSRKRPSIGLFMALYPESRLNPLQIRKIFAYNASLIKFRLISLSNDKTAEIPFMSRTLQIDERIVSFLLDENCIDQRIHSISELIFPTVSSDKNLPVWNTNEQQIAAAVNSCKGESGLKKRLVIYLYGKCLASRPALVSKICRTIHIPLLTVDINLESSNDLSARDVLFYALREALLSRAAVYIPDIDRLLGKESHSVSSTELIRLLREMGSIVFLAGDRQWCWPVPNEAFLFLPIELNRPDFEQHMIWWKKSLESFSDLSEKYLIKLISKYPLAPAQIDNAVTTAIASALLRNEPVSQDDLDHACRMQNIPDLGSFAVRVEPCHTWEDLILPETQVNQLHDICNQVTNRELVYGKWGFGNKLSLGRGLHALFSGPPGTGKTMAAEVIANELHLDLYKIDLSQIVSKYIGETEKNLNTIFSQAQKGHTILLFDEADALLGKRSEVRDAHDRYANLEIAYLLQKMEEYEGVSILTTNFRQNMDEAFTRRIRFIVEFPFPEEEYRHRIWKGIWPGELPLSKDIDFAELANKFRLAGGSIRNIALSAAFYASANGNVVEMKHLLTATREEFRKMGRLIDESEYLPKVKV